MIEKQHIDELVRYMAGIFPAWQTAMKTDDEMRNFKRVWHQGLSDMGITPDMMRKGLTKCAEQTSAFLPSLGQFVVWCRSDEHPTPAQAWQHAAFNKKENALVVEAASRTGTFDIRQNPDNHTRQLFLDHYADVIREAQQGAVFELPKPPETERRIEDTRTAEQRDADRRLASARMKEIYAILDGGGKAE